MIDYDDPCYVEFSFAQVSIDWTGTSPAEPTDEEAAQQRADWAATTARSPPRGPDHHGEHRTGDRQGRESGAGWQVRYRDPNGRQRAKNFARKTDATRFRSEVERDLARREYVDHRDETTVIEFARKFLDGRPYKPATRSRYANFIERHVAGTGLGDQRLVTVKPSDLQSWASGRSEVLKPGTMSNLLTFVRGVFANAVLNGLIAKTPVLDIRVASVEREKVVPPTVAEVRRLAACDPG